MDLKVILRRGILLAMLAIGAGVFLAGPQEAEADPTCVLINGVWHCRGPGGDDPGDGDGLLAR